MELKLENFQVRNTKPIILGNAGFPKGTERYHLEGMKMIGLDLFSGDKVTVINIEGSQNIEMVFFDVNGNCKSLINKNLNGEAQYIKEKIKDKIYKNFIQSLKKKTFNFENLNHSIFLIKIL